MVSSSEKLGRDVDILEAMAAEMGNYLDSDVLFWPMARSDMPMLTLGGYLMREHRLLALSDQLSSEQQGRVAAAVQQFNQTLAERIVRFETKAGSELEARLRQWEAFLKDVDRGTADKTSNYSTAVETRAMLAALMDRLSMPPYETNERTQQHLVMLDQRLRNHWVPGEFVWPDDWQPAYPRDEYPWLYGGFRSTTT